MQIVRSLSALPRDPSGPVIAIGNFDGVHRGHRALLSRARAFATDAGKPFGVLTFEPHPRSLFRPDEPPARLTPPWLKERRMADSGVDILYALPFDWPFASQSAEGFIETVLDAGIKPSRIFVGADFCFGQLRSGTPDTLVTGGYDVTVVEKVSDSAGEPLSSSRIRQFLRQGDIAGANALLGWEWEVGGIILRGDRRGHALGYPTANVALGDTLHPAYGIYAALVNIEGEDGWRPAATNIGIRPMFALREGQVEAHILNFPDRDIYDRFLRVKPVKRLRGEAKFESIDALIVQMEKDCAQARDILVL